MTEHAAGYSFNSAMELARTLKHGPLPDTNDPMPTPQEALELLREERRTCGFNWLTGEVAEAVVAAFVAGSKAGKNTANPYPECTSENRAWLEGKGQNIPAIEEVK